MSIHKSVVRELVNDNMADDPQFCSFVADYLRKMRRGFFSQESIDMVVQKIHGYDIYDAYCFAQVRRLISSGELAMATLDIGFMPRADVEVEYHNLILQKAPDCHFWGEFWGGLADEDGYLTWAEDVVFERQFWSENDDSIERLFLQIEPYHIPLEVGYTESSRTWIHLCYDGALARWPYNSRLIYVFIMVDKDKYGSAAISKALSEKRPRRKSKRHSAKNSGT